MAIGDLVDVSTDTGTITMPIEISQDIMQGVVSIPHGFGHKKKGVQLRFAASDERAGVSVNDITDHNRIDKVTGNAAFSGTKVRITKTPMT